MKSKAVDHPSSLHLAAMALGKLKPDAAVKVESHVSACDECQQFLSSTPRDTLQEYVRNAKHKNAAEQNTHATGLSGTVTEARPVSPTVTFQPPANPEPQSMPSSDPGTVVHSLGSGEIPSDLFNQTKYRIRRVLGRGGMGTVYEAEHVRMKRPVAIKVINPELVDHPQALARFETEVHAVAALDHPNIARAFDAECFGALQTIVMEFVSGQTLSDLLKLRGKLSTVEACRCVRQALLGLEHAHQRGLVHRDLKPQNLMVTRDSGIIKILDFGLAKAVSENRQSRGLTKTNATMGTYAYMSPEQALDAAQADIRADIYSLGCTLYYLIAGELPFDYDSDAKLLLAHQNETPRTLKEVCPEVPAGLSELVARMLAKDPEDRPQTPREAAGALLPYAKGDRVTLSETTPVARSSGWMWGGTIAAALALAWFGAWAAGLLSIQTPQGTIVLSNVPDDADISVDGEIVTITRSDETVIISAVDQGSHHLKVVQGEHEIWSNDVVIEFGGELVSLKLEPLVTPSDTAATKDQSSDKEEIAQTPHERNDRSPPDTSPTSDQVPETSQELPKSLSARISGGLKIEGRDTQVLSTGSWGEVFLGDPTWAEYDITFKLLIVRGTGLNLHFHWVDGSNTRIFDIGSPKQGWCDLSSKIAGSWDNTVRRRRSVGLDFDKWYEVRLEVRGSHARCIVDGVEWYSNNDERLTAGLITLLMSENAEARIRDFVVKSPDGATLWRGLPKSPAGVPQENLTESPASKVPTLKSAASSSERHPTDSLESLNISAYVRPESVWRGVRKNLHGGVPNAEKNCDLRVAKRDGNSFSGVVIVRPASRGRGTFEGEIQGDTLTWNEHYRGREVKVRAKLNPNGLGMTYTFEADWQNGGGSDGEGQLSVAVVGDSSRTEGTVVDQPNSETDRESEFTPIFNGKDLEGWTIHPSQRGDWNVDGDGFLVGRGQLSHLYTQRGDYENVHVRIVARINDGGNSGVSVRSRFGPTQDGKWVDGYEAQIDATARDPNRTGSLYGGGLLVPVTRSLTAPGELFVEEIIAIGNHVTVKVNGEQTADYVDQNQRFKRGHIVLQVHDGQTVVAFKSVEVKELPAANKRDNGLSAIPGSANLVAGSVWKGTHTNIVRGNQAHTTTYSLYVTERKGNKFEGHSIEDGPRKNRAEVEGTLSRGSLSWQVRGNRSTSQIKGVIGPTGKTIQLEYTTEWNNGFTRRGVGTLELDRN